MPLPMMRQYGPKTWNGPISFVVHSAAVQRMRSRPEIFEDNADKCDQLALGAKQHDLRVLYHDLASQWRELAATVRWLQAHPTKPQNLS
jgi:hypothetical protein